MSNLTKKVWNTLSKTTRVDIIEVVKGDIDSLPQFYRDLTERPYRHDFNFDHKGEKLKEILSHCRMEADGTIDVVITIKPTYAPVEREEKDVALTKVSLSSLQEKKWYVDYEDRSGDLNHVWVMAYSAKEAEEMARSEYWDLEEIIQVREAN